MKTKEIDLKFIPCDLHPLVTAVMMEIQDNGAVRFKCRGCDIVSNSTNDDSRQYNPAGSQLESLLSNI